MLMQMQASPCALYSEGSTYCLRKSTMEDSESSMQDSIITLNDADYHENYTEFLHFAKQSMRNYKALKRDLYKLILRLRAPDNKFGISLLVTGLILDALRLSVKKLDIKFEFPSIGSMKFLLPQQLFDSPSLTELIAENCLIKLPITENLLTLHLVTLDFTSVDIGENYSDGNELLRRILGKCPMLEYLYMSECMGFTRVNLSGMHRLKFCALHLMSDGAIPGLISVAFFEQGWLTPFRNLTTLILFSDVDLESTFFHNFKSKFPCLTEFSFHACNGVGKVEIVSPTLQYLTLEVHQYMDETLVLDVPSIRSFQYWGSEVPRLSFSTSSNELESEIVLKINKNLPCSWFLRVREFLQKLSSNKVSLALNLQVEYVHIGKLTEDDISGVPPIRLENLVFEEPLGSEDCPMPESFCSDVVKGLFSFCRPNFLVDQSSLDLTEPERVVSALKLLRKLVEEQEDWKSDLKQVTFEMFNKENTLTEWRMVPWDDLVSALIARKKGLVRIKLAWNGDESN